MTRSEAERLDQIEQRLDGVLTALTATVDALGDLQAARAAEGERTDRMLTLMERLTGAPSRPQPRRSARHLHAVE